jgi:DNA-binding response OmpR family regulator
MEKKGKVIIVDDDSFILGLYAEKASQKGLDVRTSLGGEKFLQMIEDVNFIPDVVVMDLMMPDMSGKQVIEKVQQSGLLTNTKFIILTNVDDENTMKEMESYKVFSYLVKSTLTPNDMVDKILEAVEK